ncbi:uncharacterized protein EDB91DRAFT_730877 [Suillus paluster]|uniref:uncharacterized protein n=1 Tax=Suillus paluster TaxID=48578 RepID=UPI001B86E2E5|nr:uncharacterized protein EDB91DRAFT_730877 [Suillus paluster]KAG1731208.1 hypothetical protein EDB91DRAFT_730877 [Suillus paluster]
MHAMYRCCQMSGNHHPGSALGFASLPSVGSLSQGPILRSFGGRGVVRAGRNVSANGGGSTSKCNLQEWIFVWSLMLSLVVPVSEYLYHIYSAHDYLLIFASLLCSILGLLFHMLLLLYSVMIELHNQTDLVQGRQKPFQLSRREVLDYVALSHITHLVCAFSAGRFLRRFHTYFL